MLCQACKQNPAALHATSIKYEYTAPGPDGKVAVKFVTQEQSLCEACAKSIDMPLTQHNVWKLLGASQSSRAKREIGATCPDCGMTLRDFRQRGRLGCAKDYEIFGAPLRDLLERIHGATQHSGRGPNIDEASFQRQQRISELRQALDTAIRDEAYEAAAKLRDELRTLQQS